MEEARPWCHVQSGHLPGLLCPPRLDPGHTGEPDFYSLCILGWSLVWTLGSPFAISSLRCRVRSPQPSTGPGQGPCPGLWMDRSGLRTHTGGGTGHAAGVGWLPALEELAV